MFRDYFGGFIDKFGWYTINKIPLKKENKIIKIQKFKKKLNTRTNKKKYITICHPKTANINL